MNIRISHQGASKVAILESSAILIGSVQDALGLMVNLQYVNYGTKIAMVGDFKKRVSKSLNDFIYESNRGKNFFFVETEQAAIDALHHV